VRAPLDHRRGRGTQTARQPRQVPETLGDRPLAPWLKALGRVASGSPTRRPSRMNYRRVDLERVARVYRAQLAEQEVVDFDEQVTGAIERLLRDPAFAYGPTLSSRAPRGRVPGSHAAHLLLIRLLSGPAGAVFAVGDDDRQSMDMPVPHALAG